MTIKRYQTRNIPTGELTTWTLGFPAWGALVYDGAMAQFTYTPYKRINGGLDAHANTTIL